jgi:cytochrome b involved in lipid metabolism
MKKNVIFVLIALVVVVILTFVFKSSPAVKTPVGSTTGTTTSTTGTTGTVGTVSTSTTSTAKTYTMADVAKHADSSSCWTVVNNGVYDVTSFISGHPGGSGAILSLCGHDGTAGFEDQHGGQRRPTNELASLKIGDLAQ